MFKCYTKIRDTVKGSMRFRYSVGISGVHYGQIWDICYTNDSNSGKINSWKGNYKSQHNNSDDVKSVKEYIRVNFMKIVSPWWCENIIYCWIFNNANAIFIAMIKNCNQ